MPLETSALSLISGKPSVCTLLSSFSATPNTMNPPCELARANISFAKAARSIHWLLKSIALCSPVCARKNSLNLSSVGSCNNSYTRSFICFGNFIDILLAPYFSLLPKSLLACSKLYFSFSILHSYEKKESYCSFNEIHHDSSPCHFVFAITILSSLVTSRKKP